MYNKYFQGLTRSLVMRTIFLVVQYKTHIAEACDCLHNSISQKLPVGNSTWYFTCYIEILREICNNTARVK